MYIILQGGVLLAWFAVIRGQFSQICFSRRGCVGPLCHLQRKLGHLLPQIRIPRILGTTTEAQVDNTQDQLLQAGYKDTLQRLAVRCHSLAVVAQTLVKQ